MRRTRVLSRLRAKLKLKLEFCQADPGMRRDRQAKANQSPLHRTVPLTTGTREGGGVWHSGAVGHSSLAPHAHWEAHGRGSLPPQNPVSDSANPLTTRQIRYHSHCGIIVALDCSEP